MKPGDKVQLTAAFLRNTGQLTGPEPFKQWAVQPCDCGLCETGGFVAVDEPHSDEPDRLRHINRANLKKVGQWEPN